MRCVQITGSDDRMDCRDMFYDPINPLPRKCAKCGFPDLNSVPQPYFLVKSRTLSPNELAPAENGNFLIRERVRPVLDLLAPGQCSFFSTCYKGTSEKTPWLLAVPNHQVVTAKVDPSISRCAICGEPRSAHPGTQWSEMLFGRPPRNQARGEGWTADSDYDVFKSSLGDHPSGDGISGFPGIFTYRSAFFTCSRRSRRRGSTRRLARSA
jgi:hypothetical protein